MLLYYYSYSMKALHMFDVRNVLLVTQQLMAVMILRRTGFIVVFRSSTNNVRR